MRIGESEGEVARNPVGGDLLCYARTSGWNRGILGKRDQRIDVFTCFNGPNGRSGTSRERGGAREIKLLGGSPV